MIKLIPDLIPGQTYAIQFRSNTGEQVSEWSNVQRFTTTNDVIPPSQPANLSWYNSGAAFIGQWDKVTTQATNPVSPMKDFKHYRCNITDGTAKSVDKIVITERVAFSKEENSAAFGTFKNNLTLRVYAVDNSGNESLAAQSTVNPANPSVPSAPVLRAYFGSLMAEWDGKDVAGAAMPANLDYLEVHIGTTNNFTPSASTLQVRLYPNLSAISQRALLSGLDPDKEYYARFVAVNLSNKKSNVSAVSNAARQTRITGLDIQPNGIGTDQINFTARDLGGANAFYGTTQPQVGVNGVTVIKSGDIWYDTNTGPAGGNTYRYDGASFILDNSIGVISGKKILTNTLTADAVGTNLLITDKANIGNAVIDSASISFLDAGKITTGVFQSSFMVNYGGLTQPAFSFDMNGNAVLNNIAIKGQAVVGSGANSDTQNGAFAIRSHNYVTGSTGWTINGDGSVEFSKATIRGIYKTAETGRRIEMGSAGSIGILQFFNPVGATQWIRSFSSTSTITSNTVEYLQFRGGDEGLIQVTSDNSVGIWGVDTYIITNRGFRVSTADPQLANNQKLRFAVDDTFRYIDANTKWRLHINNEFNYWHPDGYNRFHMGDETVMYGVDQGRTPYVRFRHNDGYWSHGSNQSGAYQEFEADGEATFHTPSGTDLTMTNEGVLKFGPRTNAGWIEILSYGAQQNSPYIRFYNPMGYGGMIKFYSDGGGIGARMEMRAPNDDKFIPIQALNVDINSDASTKRDITDVDNASLLASVRGTSVKKYRRVTSENKGNAKNAKTAIAVSAVEQTPEQPEEIGLLAQDAPEQIRGLNASDGTMTIGLYQMTTTLWGSTAELADRVEKLEATINELRGKIKK